MKHELIDNAVKIAETCDDLCLATVRPDGFPQATTVSFVHDGLTLFFCCGDRSQKARNLRADPRASVTMTAPYENWNEIKGLSLAAHAAELTTPAEQDQVLGLMLARFPKMTDFEPEETGTIAFFKLTPFVLSVLDYGKGFGQADTVTLDEGDVANALESMKHRWLAAAG